jgi:hypothetical protein
MNSLTFQPSFKQPPCLARTRYAPSNAIATEGEVDGLWTERPRPGPKHRVASPLGVAASRAGTFRGNKDENKPRNSLSAVCQKPRRGHEPWVFHTLAARSAMKIKAGFLPVRSDSHRKIQPHTKAFRRAQIQPREVPQSGVNSRILEFESRCTGVPECRPSEK